MPRYYEEDISEEEYNGAEDNETKSTRSTGGRSEPRIEHTYIVLFLLFFYYFCSCGIERLFQSMVSEWEREAERTSTYSSRSLRESGTTFTFFPCELGGADARESVVVDNLISQNFSCKHGACARIARPV